MAGKLTVLFKGMLEVFLLFSFKCKRLNPRLCAMAETETNMFLQSEILLNSNKFIRSIDFNGRNPGCNLS